MKKKSAEINLIPVALALSLGAAVALGFARFNYALLLPAMRNSLAWSYTQAGSMNTANALGYLTGALLVTPTAKRFGLQRTFWVSLTIIGLSLLGTGLTTDFSLLLLLRLAAGWSGAGTFITGATLASHLASQGRAGLVLGIYFGGVGLGIFIAGLGLPQLLDINVMFWQSAWVLMGILTLVAVFYARRAAFAIATPTTAQNQQSGSAFTVRLLPALMAYFLFGLGYITYMTFVIAYLRSDGLTSWALSGFWLILGISTFASAFVWSGLLDSAKGGKALAVVLSVVAIGAALPVYSTSLLSIAISALLFGGAFLTVVSAVTNIVRKSLPASAWPSGLALFTVIFSVGQTVGPLISGVLADRTQTLTGGFILSAMVLTVALLLALLQQEISSEVIIQPSVQYSTFDNILT